MHPHTKPPFVTRSLRWRRTLHRLIDPALVWRSQIKAARLLYDLHDGDYTAPVEVPYVAQFASPHLIYQYIHEGLHGRDDPNWQAFGSDDPDSYTFWAHRACAIACLKMAVDAFGSASPRSMWQLVQDGLAFDGYRVHDEAGRFVDMGWYYPALVKLGEQNGLEVRGRGYVSLLDICAAIRDGWLVAAGVTPELGEHGPFRRYDGHFVLVYGFTWRHGKPTHLKLHNPSGRYPELQASATIPAARFRAAFAHRFILLRPRQASPAP